MRKPGGWGYITHPDGKVEEHETYTCKHCNRVTRVKARQRAEDIGGLCKACMGLTCPQCTAHGRCTPLERDIAQQLEREYRRRQYA